MIRLFTSIMGGLVLLTACQTGPEARSTARDGGSPPDARQGQIVASPIALVFVGLDHDHNQRVTLIELETHLPTLFERSDKNASGGLDAAEIRAFFIRHLGSEYPVPGRLAFDPNGNQLVDQSEFIAVFTDAFARMDANGDDELAREEMLRELRMGTGRARGRGGRGGSGRGGGRG